MEFGTGVGLSSFLAALRFCVLKGWYGAWQVGSRLAELWHSMDHEYKDLR